nr:MULTISPECIES: MFS transporter [Nocardia]
MINQFAINLGFYMLMPYLAGYLSGALGLAAWTVGLVLGVRNFSQQGMFLIGGTLADRLGFKPLIVAGCLLRTAGFGLLAVVDTLPALVIASAATGFAGALFNPAVRGYLAADAGKQRVETFAMFNLFYQAGILAGPLVGLGLMTLDFQVTAACAAAVFAILTVGQLAALPSHPVCAGGEKTSVGQDWRTVVTNRTFVGFSIAMIGAYVLSFQVYLAMPLHAAILSGQHPGTGLVTAVFVVFGTVSVLGQMRITRWLSVRYGRRGGLAIGVGTLGVAFTPMLLFPGPGGSAAVAALLISAALLAIGSAAVFPFEMDTIVAVSGNRLVATHYGFYNTVVGTGVLVGNLGTATLLDLARRSGSGALAWSVLVAIGVVAAIGVYILGRIVPPETSQPAEVAVSRS